MENRIASKMHSSESSYCYTGVWLMDMWGAAFWQSPTDAFFWGPKRFKRIPPLQIHLKWSLWTRCNIQIFDASTSRHFRSICNFFIFFFFFVLFVFQRDVSNFHCLSLQPAFFLAQSWRSSLGVIFDNFFFSSSAKAYHIVALKSVTWMRKDIWKVRSLGNRTPKRTVPVTCL